MQAKIYAAMFAFPAAYKVAGRTKNKRTPLLPCAARAFFLPYKPGFCIADNFIFKRTIVLQKAALP